MFSFNNLITTKKGNEGERIVDNLLLSKGYIPYAPNADVAHPFDRICASRDKRTMFVVEIKTKARRNYYPDTGIDVKSYKGYKHIMKKYRVEVALFFVDEMLGKIYGGKLSQIEKPHNVVHNGKTLKYPLFQNNIIYFPLERLTVYADLDSKDAELLMNLSSRNYDYNV